MTKLFCYLTSVTFLCFNSIFAQAIPTPVPFATFPFDGSVAETTAGNIPTTNNGVTFTTNRKGEANKAASFSSGSNVNVGNVPAFNFTSGYSITFWAKVNSNTTTNNFIQKVTPGRDFWIESNGGKLSTHHAKDANSYIYTSDTAKLQPNEWYHIAVVYWMGEKILYKDGVEVKRTTVPANLAPAWSGQSLIIGGNTVGAIDDIKFYNQPLDAEEIKYQSKDRCAGTLTLQPAADGIDAVIFSRPDVVATNYGNHSQLNALAWSWDGTLGFMRSLLKFDLNDLPVNVNIASANLTLKNVNTSASYAPASFTKLNASKMYVITEDWDESTVTWNTQPAFDLTSNVIIPTSTTNSADAILDVKQDVANFYKDPSSNFGWMLKLDNEAKYTALTYHSSDAADAKLAPKLVVNYTCPTSIITNANESLVEMNSLAYPNPTSGKIKLNVDDKEWKLSNINGVEVASGITSEIDLTTFKSGVYFLKSGNIIQKIIKE